MRQYNARWNKKYLYYSRTKIRTVGEEKMQQQTSIGLFKVHQRYSTGYDYAVGGPLENDSYSVSIGIIFSKMMPGWKNTIHVFIIFIRSRE